MMNNNFNNNAANNNFNSENGGFIMSTGTIKTMEAFVGTVKSAMEVYFGEDYKVQVHTVIKNNDLQLTGLTILSKQSNMAPTIYLEQYFEQYKAGELMADICQQIIRVYEEYKVTDNFDASSVTDFNRIKNRICYKLINREQNQKLLMDTPYVEFYDLALIFYIVVSNDSTGLGIITIKEHMQKLWGVDTDTLYDLAIQNTQRMFRGKVESLGNVVMEILEEKMEEEGAREFYDMMADVTDAVPMYVCTNTSKMNGAGVIFYEGILREFARRIDNDFYILPSSIHEALFVPATDDMDADYLKEMVRSVNATEVSPEEVLSDNVYIYNRLTDRVEIA